MDTVKKGQPEELKRLGKYVVMDVLGRGGMGVVYRALDNQLGREVAIKTLTRGVADDPEMLARFYEEGRKTARLKHLHIVTVYDLGEENGIPYIVMERVEGDSLEKLIRDNSPLSVMDRLRIVGEMCAALGYAHSNNVIHRDVKPANIFVQPNGNAKLLDFGIARLEKRNQEMNLTRTGHIVGTVPYIAPERLKDKFIDGRSDIFSIGVVLFQLLTGQLPFTGEDYVLMQKIINDPHPRLSSLCDNIPAGVEAIVDKSLAKSPDDRYQTAEEMAADIDAVIEIMRQQEVVELVPKARQLLEVHDLTRARILLQQVLKVQSRHIEARELLSEVQRQLVRRQRDERLEQICQQAEDSLRNREFDDGISVLKEGLTLDSKNTQLIALLERIQNEKKRKEQIDELVRRVDNARRKGDYQTAIASAHEAMNVDKANSKLIVLCNSLIAEAEQVQRRAQARALLDDARRQLQGRCFERALELLTRVEELNPAEPEVQILRADANAGFEQNRRKSLTAELEEKVSVANSIEQLQLCRTEIRQAMVTMPSEPVLVRLNAQVERRIREFEHNRLVEGTIQACRDLSPREAVELVRRTRQQFSTDERLLSLEARLQERIQQQSAEERRAAYLTQAHDALRTSRFTEAVQILETCQSENLADDEVTALLQFARNEEAEQNRELLKRTMLERAQCLIDGDAFDEAIALLSSALSKSDDSTLRLLRDQTTTARDSQLRQVNAALQSVGRMVRANKIDEAAQLLKGLPKEVSRSPRVQRALFVLDDQKNRALYRHIGRGYAVLNSEPSTSKTIAQRVATASEAHASPFELAQALSARIGQ